MFSNRQFFFFFFELIACAITESKSPKTYILRNEGQTPHTLKPEGSDLKNSCLSRIPNFTIITIKPPLQKKI